MISATAIFEQLFYAVILLVGLASLRYFSNKSRIRKRTKELESAYLVELGILREGSQLELEIRHYTDIYIHAVRWLYRYDVSTKVVEAIRKKSYEWEESIIELQTRLIKKLNDIEQIDKQITSILSDLETGIHNNDDLRAEYFYSMIALYGAYSPLLILFDLSSWSIYVMSAFLIIIILLELVGSRALTRSKVDLNAGYEQNMICYQENQNIRSTINEVNRDLEEIKMIRTRLTARSMCRSHLNYLRIKTLTKSPLMDKQQ